MIEYSDEVFGLKTLARLHGSAVLRALIPSFFSTMILIVAVYGFNYPIIDNEVYRPSLHPYVFQVLIATITFLITYRANFAYQRYWEAATAIHLMSSKWMDGCACLAACHYQSRRFQKIAPPSFGNHPDLLDMGRKRKSIGEDVTKEDYLSKLDSDINSGLGTSSGLLTLLNKKRKASLKLLNLPKQVKKRRDKRQRARQLSNQSLINRDGKSITTPRDQVADLSERGHRDRLKELSERGFRRNDSPAIGETDQPEDYIMLASPLLQHAVHLYSLLSAVSMATLRNDIPGVNSPLTMYEIGVPFPPVDPDKLSKDIRQEYGNKSRFWTVIYFILGISRSDKHRTLYNHARPFPVLGGISDNEVKALRQARGPTAKVSLCFMWIEEFVARELINGGLGPMHPAIVTRIHQFNSEGMKGYNDSRKISYIPFPFAHAQLTMLFIAVVIWILPLLFYSYVNSMLLACLLNFSTVLCFVGLQEVASEIENPFLHVPNNLPLTTFQAQYNEALITTWAGFHPDAYFDLPSIDLPCLTENHSGND